MSRATRTNASRRGGIYEHTPDYKASVIDAPPNHLAVACDKPGTQGSKWFFSFPTISALLQWYEARTPKCCYEILRETLPVCVAFDVEYEFLNPRHEEKLDTCQLSKAPDEFLRQLIHAIAQRLPQLAAQPPLVSSSHAQNKKISFHIKYDGFVLPTMKDRDIFKQLVMVVFEDMVPLIDPSVYSKRKNMRLLFSHKYESPDRSLVPMTYHDGSYHPTNGSFDAAVTESHMWCIVPSTAIPFDFTPYNDILTVVSPRRGASSSNRTDSSKKRIRETHTTDDVWVSAIRNVIRAWKFPETKDSLAGCADLPVQVKRRDAFGPGGSLYFFTAGERTCPHGHAHVSDNFGIYVTTSGRVYMTCFSSECSGPKKQTLLGCIVARTPLLPVGSMTSLCFSGAAAHKLRPFGSSSGLWTAHNVRSATWPDDGTACTLKLNAPFKCSHCGVSRFDTVRITTSQDKGTATVSHDGSSTRGAPCNANIERLVAADPSMHVAFETARLADSRELAPEERTDLARALGRPRFERADAGWSAALELCVVLRARDSRNKPFYLVMQSASFDHVRAWESEAPWFYDVDKSFEIPSNTVESILNRSVN